jgi:hypothetical protein
MDACYAAEDTVTGSVYEFVRPVWIFPGRFGGTMWQHNSPCALPLAKKPTLSDKYQLFIF